MAPKVLNDILNLPSCPLHIINTQTGDCKSLDCEQPQRAVRSGNPESSAALLQLLLFQTRAHLIVRTERPLLTFVQATSQVQTPTSTQGCSTYIFSKSNSAHAHQTPSLKQTSTQYMGSNQGIFLKTAPPLQTKTFV